MTAVYLLRVLIRDLAPIHVLVMKAILVMEKLVKVRNLEEIIFCIRKYLINTIPQFILDLLSEIYQIYCRKAKIFVMEL